MPIKSDKRIAHLWSGGANLTIREHLCVNNKYDEEDCPLNMDNTSGFLLWLTAQNTTTRFSGFVPEAGVHLLKSVLPTLTMNIACAEPYIVSSKEDLPMTEENMFQTPILFGPYKGMTISDLLYNHFSSFELQKLKVTLTQNANAHPINYVLCAGINRAIELMDNKNSQSTQELYQIIRTHSLCHATLFNGAWNEAALLNNGLTIHNKLDIFANYRADSPILLRLTQRMCKKEAKGLQLEYPYMGNQIQTACVTFDLNTLQGHFLYPMELSSQKFRQKVYDYYYLSKTI